MKFTAIAVLAVAHSASAFSYLENLGSAAPAVSNPVSSGADAPFFFTNQAAETGDSACARLDTA